MAVRPVLHRAFSDAGDLEIRSDKRTIVGLAVPFGVKTTIGYGPEAFDEMFQRGAFARTISERGPERVKTLAQHDRQLLPVGRASVLRETDAGLHAELKVSRTQLGDEILELVRDGVLDSLSVCFEAVVDDTSQRGLIIRTEVKLREISIVPWPAYPDALISGIRAQQGTPVRNAARARQDALRAKFSEYLT